MFWHFFCLALNKDGSVCQHKLVLSRVERVMMGFFVRHFQVRKHRRCCLSLWRNRHWALFYYSLPSQVFIKVREVPGICLCDTAEGRKVPCVPSVVFRERNHGDCLLVDLDGPQLISKDLCCTGDPVKSSV